jgi:polar amino acid transport system substrate-binding protein
MAFQYGNSYRGFEIDLATEIVQRLFGDQLAIDWIPIASKERVASVQSGDIDFLIRSFARTTSREELVSFTSSYFLDGVGLFARQDSGYMDIQSLDGKTILVPNENYGSLVKKVATEEGVDVDVLVTEDVYQAFESEQGDAIAVNWLAYIISINDHNEYQAVGDLIDSYPIAIAVSLEAPDFREEIDKILLEIITDGTWQTIYDDWIPLPPPWTIEKMLSEPALDR